MFGEGEAASFAWHAYEGGELSVPRARHYLADLIDRSALMGLRDDFDTATWMERLTARVREHTEA